MKRSGFTLVEIIVSLGIVAVVVAIVTPALNTARRVSQVHASLSNLRQLHVALTLYRTEWDGNDQYGNFAGMGLPTWDEYVLSGLPGFPPNKALPSPCGSHFGFPVLNDYQYLGPYSESSFNKDSLEYKDNLVIFADFNCNDNDAPLWSPYFNHRGLGVLLGGQLINQYKVGDMHDPGWWAKPAEGNHNP